MQTPILLRTRVGMRAASQPNRSQLTDAASESLGPILHTRDSSVGSPSDSVESSPGTISPTPQLPLPPPHRLRVRTAPLPSTSGPIASVPACEEAQQTDADEEQSACSSDSEESHPAGSQATVVQLHFTTSLPGKYSSMRRRQAIYTHSVRLVYLHTHASGCSSSYVHVLDLLNLLLKPATPMTPAMLSTKAYFTPLKRYMTRLCDEDITSELSRASTAPISMRSQLLSLVGLHALLAHHSIRKSVAARVSHYGEDFRAFLEVTIAHNMRVMNQGPQPDPGPPPPEEQEKRREKGAAEATADKKDEMKKICITHLANHHVVPLLCPGAISSATKASQSVSFRVCAVHRWRARR